MYDNNITKRPSQNFFRHVLLLLLVAFHQVEGLSQQEFVDTYKHTPPSVKEYWQRKVNKKIYTIEKDLAGYQEKEAWLKTLEKGTIEKNDVPFEKGDAAVVEAIVRKLRSWGYGLEDIPDFYIHDAVEHPIDSAQFLRQDIMRYYNIALAKKLYCNMPLYEQAVHAARAIEAQRAYQPLSRIFYRLRGDNSREMHQWINSMNLHSTVNACMQVGGRGCEILATYFQNMQKNIIKDDIKQACALTEEQKIVFLQTVSNDRASYAYALLLKAISMENDASKKSNTEILTDAEIEELRSKSPLFPTINFTRLVHDLKMDAANTHIFNPDYKTNGLPRWVPKTYDAKS